MHPCAEVGNCTAKMVRASLRALRLILTTKASVWFSQEGKEKDTAVFERMWEGTGNGSEVKVGMCAGIKRIQTAGAGSRQVCSLFGGGIWSLQEAAVTRFHRRLAEEVMPRACLSSLDPFLLA